jgi:RNA polymerase sigma factor (sigma-70 family)
MGDPTHSYARRHKSLLAYFGRRGSDAEDLAQDTWVRFLAYGRARSVDEPDALLKVMARRVLIDHLRHRRPVPAAAEGSDPLLPDFSSAAVNRVALAGAIRKLSPDDQRLLRWRFQDGQPLDRIAARLGITSPACRQRLVRALRRLRELLDEV